MTDRIGDILYAIANGKQLSSSQMARLQIWGNLSEINNNLVSEWNKMGTRYIDEDKIWRTIDSSAAPVSPDEETLEVIASTGDGYIEGQNATWAIAQTTSTSFNSGATTFLVGQDNNSGTFSVWRPYLKFDTSALGTSATVISARLKMQVLNMGPTRGVPAKDDVDNDFDIKIVQYDWSASDPVDAGNRETVYDGIFAAAVDVVWSNTKSINELGTYTSGLLDTTYINVTGTTYYGLRGSTTSAPATDETERVDLVSADSTAGVKPTLVIQYIP